MLMVMEMAEEAEEAEVEEKEKTEDKRKKGRPYNNRAHQQNRQKV